MNNQVFLTGASGFVGKLLNKFLERKKLKVTKAVHKSSRHKKDIKIDLTKKIYLKRNFNWIIHTAAHHKINDFKIKPKLKAKKNILMVKNLIDFSKKNNIKNFVFFSTIDINYSPYPANKDIYIKSKTFCEKILLTALKKNILKKLIILRLPAIVGKKSGDNFIKKTFNNFKKNLPVNIWNKNDKYNNLIHISDLNKLIFYFIAGKNKRKKIIIDCLSSKPIKLKVLVNNLKKRLNSKSKVNYIDKENKFKKIKFNSKINYNFFTVKKVIDLLI
jgi:nucleoside-diphosphate-sugar epimerase|tara:strand:+ start:612 stop:1433 length:822 start_codon:yes stop_codon:yes gene_type:complete